MRQNKLSSFFLSLIATLILAGFCFGASASADDATMDRIQLVTQQINLLKGRVEQTQAEYKKLNTDHENELNRWSVKTATKNYLDKISLDISVSSSNLDSINIELKDSEQTINWLEKNIQEIQNQLNVLSILGLKVNRNENINVKQLQADLTYQQQLLTLEKSREQSLQALQSTAKGILALRKDSYVRYDELLKSRSMLLIKQQQVKDELAFQEQQNYWLKELNASYAKLEQTDPGNPKEYTAIEREIYYANESANIAYVQSLVARYKDQIQQMKYTMTKTRSISLLNDINDQTQILNHQINRVSTVLTTRESVLEKHTNLLYQKKNPQLKSYLESLDKIKAQYKSSLVAIQRLSESITEFRNELDQAIQSELASRQGLPTFNMKSLIDFGKELLLVPAFTFHVVKSLSSNLVNGIKSTNLLFWTFFILAQSIAGFIYLFIRNILQYLNEKPTQWHEKLNYKWIGLQLLRRNIVDIFLFAEVIASLYFFDVPLHSFIFLIYLGAVWLSYKCIMTIAKVFLVESAHDSQGHDVRLYNRLTWIVGIGAVITAITVFVHQLPMLYEIKTLCNRLFLFQLMIFSLLLLRSAEIVPNLILSHMDSQHPYLEKSIRLIGFIIPLLMLGNSIIGLLGYVNLVLSMAWYEGLFMVVLILYLVLRGLLSDGMEQASRLMIQYTNNGWLWTEAFLKPLDRVLRIGLVVIACATLFLLYGWDKNSPIVERLNRLLHYQLVHVLNTTITPLNILELIVVISVFYWTAKWTREFVYRMLLSRTKDMGIRNSIAILSQYSVIMVGIFISLRVLGIDLTALAAVAAAFAFGVGLGLRDLANNFACGFLILLERPLRVGDIVNVSGIEGEVINIGGRAVTIRTWEHMELMVPNAEIFNKSFTNLTAKDNIVRCVVGIKISRYDNPHEVKLIIQNVLNANDNILKDPMPDVFLRDLSDTLMCFELRYYVNIRLVESRTGVMSEILMQVWDEFAKHGIKPPYPQQEIFIRGDSSVINLPIKTDPSDFSTGA